MFLFKTFFQEHYLSVSNGLEPENDLQYVGRDLGPTCLQRLSADASMERVN